MELFKAPPEMRVFLAAAGLILWVGIWHTGFAAASWVIYLLGIFLPIAAATGICPGLAVSRLIYGQMSAGKEKPGPA
ncbi:MAG: hypothetical protein DRR03_04590 [Gammaproteobacteria bacterium]|nr:MAG: hypothetical protein DRR03_04590 [Gammaproteobacteria bacterium]